MKHPRPQRAFTITELLVSVAVTVVMLFLINEIFSRTSRAVRKGVAKSDIIGSSRAVSDQIDRDFRLMLGPNGSPEAGDLTGDDSGGILVIVQKRISTPGQPALNYASTGLTGVEFEKPGRGGDATDEIRRGDSVYRPVRSDQLVFIRFRDQGEYPIAPHSINSFTSHNDDGLARYQRVWYGHVSRTNLDGSNFDTNVGADVIQPDGEDAHLGNRGGPERFGTAWILARQSLFLGEDTDFNAGEPQPPAYYANGAWVNAPVIGSGAPAGMRYLYMGLTDYAYCSLDDPAHDTGCIVGATHAGVTHPILSADYDEPTYRFSALHNYTYAAKRLRTNPRPDTNSANLESWQIAQMHPVFMEHVSDFIVEFAADLFEDDDYGTLKPDGHIDHEEFSPTGAEDFTDVNGRAYKYRGGNIRWYTHENFANVPKSDNFDSTKPATYPIYPGLGMQGFLPYHIAGVSLPHADAAFVWRHDDNRDVHDEDSDENTTEGKWTQSDENPSYWPYLLRIRYRMHDKRGLVASGENQHGMWFEQIVFVQRPKVSGHED